MDTATVGVPNVTARTLSVSFLTQCGNNISKSAQALVDILRLLQLPILAFPAPLFPGRSESARSTGFSDLGRNPRSQVSFPISEG